MELMNNEKPEICSKCGGLCCKRMGCEVFPEDIIKRYGKISMETIKASLDTGDFAIDWWEGDIRDFFMNMHDHDDIDEYLYRSPYMRMRHVNEPFIFPSGGGQCVALTPSGCKFNWNLRPYGGKSLVVGTLNANGI